MIDKINILQASMLAMAEAIKNLGLVPDAVLVDGLHKPNLPQGLFCHPLPHGDNLSHTVAAASILAKTTRDAIMMGLHAQYPQYGFDKHKGYGTAAHLQALRVHGPCAVHRLSFKWK
jgi:ribonuclease HII